MTAFLVPEVTLGLLLLRHAHLAHQILALVLVAAGLVLVNLPSSSPFVIAFGTVLTSIATRL